ncbi:hypothetical protein DFH09DRAFT_1149833 [Mycena vulgaris]|nr:hypothetical protein DFH09DRAFT_1192168 [Mycena vulgaris]KAJ6576598.1 hypothetical protein DFH09DRAFT_1149833 [Mycena vulgaris]
MLAPHVLWYCVPRRSTLDGRVRRVSLDSLRLDNHLGRARRRMEENSYPCHASSNTSWSERLCLPLMYSGVVCGVARLRLDDHLGWAEWLSTEESASADRGELFPVPCVVKNLLVGTVLLAPHVLSMVLLCCLLSWKALRWRWMAWRARC